MSSARRRVTRTTNTTGTRLYTFDDTRMFYRTMYIVKESTRDLVIYRRRVPAHVSRASGSPRFRGDQVSSRIPRLPAASAVVSLLTKRTRAPFLFTVVKPDRCAHRPTSHRRGRPGTRPWRDARWPRVRRRARADVARAFVSRARRRSGARARHRADDATIGGFVRADPPTLRRRPPETETWTRSRRACASASAAARRMRFASPTPSAPNWFETVADVADRSVDQLAAMGVPAGSAERCALVLREDEAAAARGGAHHASTRAGTASTSSDPIRRRRGRVDRRPAPRTGRAPPHGRPPPRRRRPTASIGRRADPRSGVRVSKRKRLPPYALRDDEIPASLARRARDAAARRHVRRVGGGRAPVRTLHGGLRGGGARLDGVVRAGQTRRVGRRRSVRRVGHA